MEDYEDNLEDEVSPKERRREELRETRKALKKEARGLLKNEAKQAVLEFLAANPEITAVLVGVFVVVILLLLVGASLFYFFNTPAEASEVSSIICLDPGHPSENAGASGEYELNYLVATELKAELENRGYEVVMTKKSRDEVVLNKKRADICANAGASLMYRIHGDSSNSTKAHPFHMYPDSSLKNIYDTSKSYTEKIHKKVVQAIGVEGKGGAQPSDGGTCTESACVGRILDGSKEANSKNLPVSLIEMMALNSQGKAWLNDASNRAKLIKGMADGIQDAVPPGGAGAGAIVQQAKYYVGHLDEYRGDAVKDYTDCQGFVLTIFKKKNIDQNLVEWGTGHQAKELIDYVRKHPEKYTIVSENLTNTSKLKPGDIMLNYKYGSHAAVFMGSDGNGNKIEASIYKHGPEWGNWYSDLHAAFRVK